MTKFAPWLVLIFVLTGLYLLHDKYFVQVMTLAGKLVNQEIPNIEIDNVILQAYHPNGKLRFKLFGTKAQIDEIVMKCGRFLRQISHLFVCSFFGTLFFDV